MNRLDKFFIALILTALQVGAFEVYRLIIRYNDESVCNAAGGQWVKPICFYQPKPCAKPPKVTLRRMT